MRLAARLTGWRIDIRSEAQMAEQEAAAQAAAVAAAEPVGVAVAAAAEAEAPAEEAGTPETGIVSDLAPEEPKESSALSGEMASMGVPALQEGGGADSSHSAQEG